MHSEWTSYYNLLMFDEIGSTNDEAKKLARSMPLGNFILSAKSQTAGRGQYGREWESRSGNLYMSILLQPEAPKEIFPQVSFLTSISLYDALNKVAQDNDVTLSISLKWPNDVLIGGAKIAGILLEAVGGYLIIGIGLNIKNHPIINGRSITSMTQLGLNKISAQEMMDHIMKAFEKRYKAWQNDGFMDLRKLWLERAHKAGDSITASDGKSRISGEFIDIDNMGAIRLRLAGGEVHTMSAGEIVVQ